MKQKHLLVLAPHADDAEFGLGAYLCKCAKQYAVIAVVIAASGDYTRDGQVISGAERRNEAVAALRHLGVQKIAFSSFFEENKALSADYVSIVSKIEELIETLKPDEVFVSLPSFNQDHRVLFDATMTALRPGRGNDVKLYGYEYPGNCWGPPPPTTGKKYLVATPETSVRKIQSLKMHRTQFDNRFVAVGPEAAVALLVQRGSEIGVPAAELVYLLREIES